LWAETEATAERLSAQRADLSRALLEEKLIATVSVEPGAPSTPAPKPGRLVDQAL
jgi:hypothetical protein